MYFLSLYEQCLKQQWRNEWLSTTDRTATERSWRNLTLHMPCCQHQLLCVRMIFCTNMSQEIWLWYQLQLELSVVYESCEVITRRGLVFFKHHQVSVRSFSAFLKLISCLLPPKWKFKLVLANLMSLFLKTDVWLWLCCFIMQ